MDRHVLWLRRRVLASIARKTAATWAVAFVVASVLILWRTSLETVGALAVAFVAAQLVAVARIVMAVRNNPLSYEFLRRYIDGRHRYTIFETDGDQHEIASELLGFYHVITVHDPEALPSPVFDLYQTADRVTTAAVSRVTGAVSLCSKVGDGRVLVTDSRVVVPHEGLVVNIAPGKHPALLIPSHHRALAGVPGGGVPEPLALKMMSRTLMLEHEAYSQLGPLLGSFLDLEPHRRSFGRLFAGIHPEELSRLGLPDRPGPDSSPAAASAHRPASQPGPSAQATRAEISHLALS
jgi:hypothetical protein